MSVLLKERANIVRSSEMDVSNLYGHRDFCPGAKSQVRRIPLEKAVQLWNLGFLRIGTLVAKEDSEQEGYKE
ncbi:MAG: hypothetical protein ACRD9S_06685 [Pyrinomonadaceae bacterium]